jgi:uncharacterized RDD family membrane protein YckC
MSTLWFYAQHQKQHGPLPSEEMRTLLSSGRLNKSTMVWSEGMESWVAAGKVEELVGITTPPVRPPAIMPNPASQPVVEVDTGGAEHSPFRGNGQSGPRPTSSVEASPAQVRSQRAWHRFFARTIDVFLGSVIIYTVLGVHSMEGFWAYILGSFVLLALIPVESWCLSRWGMTPGKWILRIRVVHADNRLLTFPEAAKRNLKVIITGMGFGLPLLQVLFYVLAYKEFMDTGTTPWDRQYKTEVQHAPMRPIHIGIAFGVGLGIVLYVAKNMA